MKNTWFFALLLGTLFGQSCGNTSTSQATSPNLLEGLDGQNLVKPSHNTLQNSNALRLYNFMQGFFLTYTQEDEKAPLRIAQLEGDSVYTYIRAIGKPIQTGYWLFRYQFRKKAPNQPLSMSVNQIRQIDRDSFEVRFWSVNTPTSVTELQTEHFGTHYPELLKQQPPAKTQRVVRQGDEFMILSPKRSVSTPALKTKYAYRQDRETLKVNRWKLRPFHFTEAAPEKPVRAPNFGADQVLVRVQPFLIQEEGMY